MTATYKCSIRILAIYEERRGGGGQEVKWGPPMHLYHTGEFYTTGKYGNFRFQLSHTLRHAFLCIITSTGVRERGVAEKISIVAYHRYEWLIPGLNGFFFVNDCVSLTHDKFVLSKIIYVGRNINYPWLQEK